jgi:predicted dinucleotide-binding enzyme
MVMQQAQAIGPTVVPMTLQDAIASDTIFLAVPFWEHREVAKQITTWHGKTFIDATNTNAPVEDLDGQPSSPGQRT